jgi:hypothetical protein
VLAPANEVDNVRWVALADVPAALTYQRDRDLLAQFEVLGQGPSRSLG